MISREEYKKHIDELTKKDENNPNLKSLSKGYKTMSIVFVVLGIFTIPIGIGIILLILGIVGNIKVSNAEKYYKKNYGPKILDFLLKEYEYKYDELGKIDEIIFQSSQMGFGNDYDRYSGEDLIVINIPNDDGSKSDNYLHLCDLDVVDIDRDEDGDTTETTVYKGVFGYVDFPFEFKCAMSINTIYRKSGVKLEKVSLEDIVFNKKFKIRSNDQIEARYILTPEMMEKLLALNEKAGQIYLVIVDKRMYIGFPNINLFELKSSNSNVESLFDNFYAHISIILNIVNEIKNNNKIFKI